MASSYSTDLKLELMVTGEQAGLWGDITNTNLNILQQAIAGYQTVSLNATTGATLAFTNGAISNGKNAVLDLTGTLTSSVNVIVPDTGSGTAPEKTYIVKNSTSGAFAVTFKTTSGTGATFAAADKGVKLLYSDGTNITDVNSQLKTISLFTLPATDGTSNQVITTNGSGVLSFATVSGGAAWQPVVTSNLTVVAKAGYFVNTSAAAITTTLPASATIGDFISFIDYSGTFDTNNLTVGRNGHNIQGDASDLTVAVERAGFTLVYVDATQGWLLQNK